MPINDLGYRHWQDDRRSRGEGWWVIAETGIQLAWKSQWLKRMLFFAWLPAAYLGVVLFLFEQSSTDSSHRLVAIGALRQLPNAAMFESRLGSNPAEVRHEIWAAVLLTLFRYPQAVLMVILVGFIAPSLISRDTRSRAFLLYFSRPINRWDYIIGKSAIVWFYVTLVTTVPAMALYVLGVFLSPNLSVVVDTWDLPVRILAASVCLILPTTAVALCFSALTNESRYAAFAWFAIWIVGWVAFANLTMMDASRMMASNSMDSRWTLVSLYHSLGEMQSWIFGLEVAMERVLPPIALWSSATVISFALLYRRVISPIRI